MGIHGVIIMRPLGDPLTLQLTQTPQVSLGITVRYVDVRVFLLVALGFSFRV